MCGVTFALVVFKAILIFRCKLWQNDHWLYQWLTFSKIFLTRHWPSRLKQTFDRGFWYQNWLQKSRKADVILNMLSPVFWKNRCDFIYKGSAGTFCVSCVVIWEYEHLTRVVVCVVSWRKLRCSCSVILHPAFALENFLCRKEEPQLHTSVKIQGLNFNVQGQ